MNTRDTTAVLLIVLPVLFNVCFGLLAANFDYPDILRQPTSTVLAKFRDGGTALILTWWGFMLSAVAFAPLAVCLGVIVHQEAPSLAIAAGATGVLAAVVQFLGLVRWPFVVPYLARESENATQGRAEMIDLTFQMLNRYLGVGVGEHLGYLFTGAWSVLVGLAIVNSSAFPFLVGLIGILLGAALMFCSLEFVGENEKDGWALAGKITPIAYVLWSVWLVALGVTLLVGSGWDTLSVVER